MGRLLLFVGCVSLLAGCDGEGGADAGGSRDAGPFSRDADTRSDAGLDAATADAGPRDAGSLDAGPSDSGADAGLSDAGPPELRLPPPNVGFDYQLGVAYAPPDGVQVVARDRTATPAPGRYGICYVNGFQTQPGERAFWMNEHPELLLRDSDGRPVVDPDWDEWMLDVTTPEKRAALAGIVGAWIDGCAAAGFDAVEIDNLDTYARSGGRVSQDDAVAFMRALADRAHARGLAIAQKNAAEVLDRRGEMDTDFAVVEECNRYDECGDFTAAYGSRIFVIEYRRGDFAAGCRDFPEVSIVLRDLLLRSPVAPEYVYDGC
ncbi:MAG: endo alpha-1,4 polygalactosaminidase [Sandaracinaceae bacterium]